LKGETQNFWENRLKVILSEMKKLMLVLNLSSKKLSWMIIVILHKDASGFNVRMAAKQISVFTIVSRVSRYQ
jgi:hypothetical protein